jgi:hypothetical protein
MKRKTIKHNRTRNKQKKKNKNRRSKKEKQGLSGHIAQPTKGRLEVSLSIFVANRISPCFHPSHTHLLKKD